MNKITQHLMHMNHFHINYTLHTGYWNFQLSEDIFKGTHKAKSTVTE